MGNDNINWNPLIEWPDYSIVLEEKKTSKNTTDSYVQYEHFCLNNSKKNEDQNFS